MRVARVWFTRVALAVGAMVGLATLGGAAAARPAEPPPARQAATKATFDVTISPRYTTAGSPTTFEVTVRNMSSAGTTLGSVQVLPPTGFKVARPVPTAPLRKKTLVQRRTTTVHALSLKPGKQQEFPVKATAPMPTNCGARTLERWTSHAFEGSTPSGAQLALQQAESKIGVIVVCPQIAPCGNGGAACSTPESTNVSSYVATSDAGSGTLVGGLDVGRRLKCAGYTPEDPNWYDTVLKGGPSAVTYQIQYTLTGANPSQIRVCFGLPYEFTTASDNNAPSARLPNGNPGFVGLLPTCQAVAGPCIASITPSPAPNPAGADVVVQVPAQTAAGAPAGDPWMGP